MVSSFSQTTPANCPLLEFAARRICFPALLLAALALPSAAATVALSGTGVCDDTTIYSNATSDNGGAGTSNRAGRTGTAGLRRLLIKFDLSSIPAGATINSATLQFYVTHRTSGTPAYVFALHRLTNAWVEGTGNGQGSGGTVVTGATSWNYRQYSTVAWATAGGDYVGTISASTSIAATNGITPQFTGAGMVADVQNWVRGTQPNYGWIMLGDESTGAANGARGFASAEATTASQRPLLTITYTPASSVNDWSVY